MNASFPKKKELKFNKRGR